MEKSNCGISFDHTGDAHCGAEGFLDKEKGGWLYLGLNGP